MKTLIISDVHGNWPALQAVLRAESDADQILCLGDLVVYGPQPDRCVAWAMGLHAGDRLIQGVHDRACGLGVALPCAPLGKHLAEATESATSHLLTPKMKRFLAAIPPLQQFRWGDATIVAFHGRSTAHGAPFPHISGQNAKWAWETDIILVGHPDKLFVLIEHPDLLFLSLAHTQIGTRWGNTEVVNPGSVGLPLDGDPRAAYAICENGKTSFRRVSYDVEETVRGLEALPLEKCFKEQLVEVLHTAKPWLTHAPPGDGCGTTHLANKAAA
jgi:predicted phosphodiesterase